MSTPTVTTTDPATGEVITRYDSFSDEQVDAALESATLAARTWATMPLPDRLDLLRRVGKELSGRREELAALITREMGKPLGGVARRDRQVRLEHGRGGRPGHRLAGRPRGRQRRRALLAVLRAPRASCSP